MPVLVCCPLHADIVEVWLSFWLLPFGAMFLALVGDEMGDLAVTSAGPSLRGFGHARASREVIDAIDRPPLLWCPGTDRWDSDTWNPERDFSPLRVLGRCLSLVLAAVQRDRRLAPARSTCEAASALGSSALQRCAELRQRVSEFSEVDMLIIGLSEARARAGARMQGLSWPPGCAAVLRLPFPRAAPRFLARLHARPGGKYIFTLLRQRAAHTIPRPGGLIAAFWLTLVVLLADVTIGIYGSRAQQVPGSNIDYGAHKLIEGSNRSCSLALPQCVV